MDDAMVHSDCFFHFAIALSSTSMFSVIAVLSLPLCSGGPLELFFGKSALWVSAESNKIHRAALQGDGLLFLIQ